MIYQRYCISFSEDRSCLSKQCRSWSNIAQCGISSRSSLFAEEPAGPHDFNTEWFWTFLLHLRLADNYHDVIFITWLTRRVCVIERLNKYFGSFGALWQKIFTRLIQNLILLLICLLVKPAFENSPFFFQQYGQQLPKRVRWALGERKLRIYM